MSVRVCGVEECRTFVLSFENPAPDDLSVIVFEEGMVFAAAPPLAPYYRFDYDSEWDQWAPVVYVPSHRVYAFGANWRALDAAKEAAFRRATRGLDPYPAPVPTRVTVNGVRVDDPAAYGSIFAGLSRGQYPGAAAAAAKIRMLGVPAPWFDDVKGIDYYPSADVLHNGPDWVQAPPGVAALVEDDLRVAAADSRSLSWPGAIALGALLGAGGWVGWRLFLRRRPRVEALPGP
jgi:hypothetical protein